MKHYLKEEKKKNNKRNNLYQQKKIQHQQFQIFLNIKILYLK